MNRWSHLKLSALLARREMRVGIRGFGVFLACLFLGVFAISAVGSFSESARSGLWRDARSLMGGDVEIRVVHRTLSPLQLAYLEARGQVSTVVEMRAMARNPAGSKRVLVELKAVDAAYPLYGAVKLEPDQGLRAALAPREGVYGAVVENSFLRRLSLGIGDRLDLGAAQYEVRGVIASEPDRAVRAFHLGPRLLIARSSLAGTGLLVPGSLAQYAYRVRLGTDPVPEANVTEFIAELNEQFPEAGWRVRGFARAAPRVRYFLDRMTTNLTLVGLCALLVGGLGVAGGVRGYLEEKTTHIAAMKCVGAPGRVIFATYLIQVLVLGAAAAGTGLVAGTLVPYIVAWGWGDALPLPLRPGIFPVRLATAAGFGLLIAIAFSLRALSAARRVPPSVLFRGYAGRGDGLGFRVGIGTHVAVAGTAVLLILLAVLASGDPRLALWFATGAVGSFFLFRGLAAAVVGGARRFPRPANPSMRLAVTNIHRPGSMAGRAIFSLGMGLTALVTVALVQSNLSALVNEHTAREAPSFFFLDIQPDQAEPFDEVARGVPGVTQVERLPTLRGRITRIGGVPVEAAKIQPEVSWAVRGDRFLTYAATPPDPREISAGSWWPEDYSGPPRISLTADLADGFGVGLGDTLTVNVLGREVTAEIANLREVDWSTLALNFAIIFAPGVLEAAPQTHLAAAYAAPDREEALFEVVTARFPNVSAIRVKELLQNVSRTLERIGIAFRAMAALALVTGFLVLSGAVSADQHRRIRDAVVFKVCGATRWNILTAFASEFLILGLAAGGVAALVGTGAAYAIVEGVMNADFRLQPAAVLLTLAVGLILTLGLGLIGTARVLTRKPAPYLRNE